jgi:hypothetical protein
MRLLDCAAREGISECDVKKIKALSILNFASRQPNKFNGSETASGELLGC